MKNLMNYFKSMEPIDQREKKLFELVNELDTESFNLFSEIIDLGDKSYYKLENLTNRVIELKKLFYQANDGYEYIKHIEESGYDYAVRRYQLNKLMVSTSTLFLIMINAFLGILNYLIFYIIANKKFANELEVTNTKIRQFDDDRILLICNTLDNCNRLLTGKLKKIDNKYFELSDILANDYITAYIKGDIENIDFLNDNTKNTIINILKTDLNSDSSDIHELLSLAKDKHTKSLKLIKKYCD